MLAAGRQVAPVGREPYAWRKVLAPERVHKVFCERAGRRRIESLAVYRKPLADNHSDVGAECEVAGHDKVRLERVGTVVVLRRVPEADRSLVHRGDAHVSAHDVHLRTFRELDVELCFAVVRNIHDLHLLRRPSNRIRIGGDRDGRAVRQRAAATGKTIRRCRASRQRQHVTRPYGIRFSQVVHGNDLRRRDAIRDGDGDDILPFNDAMRQLARQRMFPGSFPDSPFAALSPRTVPGCLIAARRQDRYVVRALVRADGMVHPAHAGNASYGHDRVRRQDGYQGLPVDCHCRILRLVSVVFYPLLGTPGGILRKNNKKFPSRGAGGSRSRTTVFDWDSRHLGGDIKQEGRAPARPPHLIFKQ